MKATSKTKQSAIASISKVCACFRLKRDAFYKYQRRHKHREAVISQVLDLVKQERKEQPRVGTRKLHNALQKNFTSASLKIGRDRLFDILTWINQKSQIAIKQNSNKFQFIKI